MYFEERANQDMPEAKNTNLRIIQYVASGLG
jgi:hypothetical protein